MKDVFVFRCSGTEEMHVATFHGLYAENWARSFVASQLPGVTYGELSDADIYSNSFARWEIYSGVPFDSDPIFVSRYFEN